MKAMIYYFVFLYYLKLMLAIFGGILLFFALFSFRKAERKKSRIIAASVAVLGLACTTPFIALHAAYMFDEVKSDLRKDSEERQMRLDDGELITAVKELDSQKVRELLEAGADANYMNSLHHTALTTACSIQAYKESEIAALTEIVQLLAESGADLEYSSGEETDSDGTLYEVLPPLSQCIMHGTKSLVPVLLRLGADVNEKSIYGTPLDLAMKENSVSTVSILLEYGAVKSRE